MIRTALAGTRAALGLTVPVGQAADSVRWARRVLQLVDDDVIPDAPLIRCEDHLTTLWLLSDSALVDRVAARELAPLDELPARRRDRLVETLRVHVSTRAPAEQVGEMLGVHAQTVRYRLRTLDAYLGDRLADPDHRFGATTTRSEDRGPGARAYRPAAQYATGQPLLQSRRLMPSLGVPLSLPS